MAVNSTDFTVGYYDDYVGEVDIYLLDENDERNEIKVDLYGNRVRKDGDSIHRHHHDHNRGHGNHVREDSMKWTKMQHNMEDQEFRLNQLQNHINAVEITISGLMKMSRETLQIKYKGKTIHRIRLS